VNRLQTPGFMRGKARLAKGFQTRDARHPARQFATHSGLMARPHSVALPNWLLLLLLESVTARNPLQAELNAERNDDEMKGVILVGGSGTRLYPLIPVDVREVLIISTPYHLLAFQAVATLGKSDYSRSVAAHVGIIR